MKTTLTVTEAINLLKLTEKKINKLKDKIEIAGVKNSKNMVNGIPESEFLAEVRRNFDSLRKLEENYRELKSKIALSNATTKVRVGSKEYTVVEALEIKRKAYETLDFYENLLYSYEDVKEEVSNLNTRVENDVNKMIETKLGSDAKNQNSDDIIELKNKLFESSKYSVAKDDRVLKEVIAIKEDLEEFLEKIDVALSIVNAKTEIEVDI